jgi:hypothetical protein
MSYQNPTEPIDPFYHRLLNRSKIRSVISILLWLTQSQHLQSIKQCSFIGNLISKYYSRKEVGYTLAVRPNHVYYALLSEILREEEIIHEVIVAQMEYSPFLFYTCERPDGPSEETTDWRDNISEGGCPPTPEDSP